jgi:hypothetical protein
VLTRHRHISVFHSETTKIPQPFHTVSRGSRNNSKSWSNSPLPTPGDGAPEKLAKLEAGLEGQSLPLAEAVPLYAELMLLALPEGRYAPLELSARQKREQTLDALAGWLLEMAERMHVLQIPSPPKHG